MKYLKFLCVCAISVSLSKLSASTLPTYPNYPVITCPDINQIQVNIMEGKASAPGGWVGQSAIPLNNQDNWQNTIEQFFANEGFDGGRLVADCSYYAYPGGKIIELMLSTPRGYFLHDKNENSVLVDSCSIVQPYHENLKNCYWATNPL